MSAADEPTIPLRREGFALTPPATLDPRLTPTAGMTGAFPSTPPPMEKAGDRIGPYTLLEELGEGGFGLVWKAVQHEPFHRFVALKVVKPGMDSREIVARFEGERQALALMDHPNIAKVLDAGTTTQGRPYFAMELVDGKPLTEFCDAKRLTLEQRLSLFIEVCQAVQHAHQKAILHRDIKPSNILVTEVDGKPVPKVIDFGIAKALGVEAAPGRTMVTLEGMFLGTPQYMSPEQVAAGNIDVDTRADIYALGVVLYELLTGATPLSRETMARAGFEEVLKLIREAEPVRPSDRVQRLGGKAQETAELRQTETRRLTMSLRGDLDWIVLKALEKDRERRYVSAQALAQDIHNHLHDVPVSASPPSRSYRLRKLVARNKLVFAALTAVTLSLVAGLTASTVLFFREQEARGRAELAEQEQAMQRTAAEIQAEAVTAQLLTQTRPMDALAKATWAVRKGRAISGMPTTTSLHALLTSLDVARTEWVTEQGLAVGSLTSRGDVIIVAPDGRIQLVDGATGRGLRSFSLPRPGADALVTAMALSQDERHLSVGWTDGTLHFLGIDFTGKAVTQQTGAGVVRQIVHQAGRNAFAVVCGDGSLRDWRTDGTTSGEPWRSPESQCSLAVSGQDGKFVALVHGGLLGTKVQLLRSTTPPTVVGRMDLGLVMVTSAAVSPDGSMVAVGLDDGSVQLWSALGLRLRMFSAHAGTVTALAFAADGRSLFSLGDDVFLRRWTTEGRALGAPLATASSTGAFVLPAPDGSRVFVGRENNLRACDLLGLQSAAPLQVGSHVRVLEWSASGGHLFALDGSGEVQAWDMSSGRELWKKRVLTSGLSPHLALHSGTDQLLAASVSEPAVHIVTRDGKVLGSPVIPMEETEKILDAAWHEPRNEAWVLTTWGRLFVVAAPWQAARLWRDLDGGAGRRFGGSLAHSAERTVLFAQGGGSTAIGTRDLAVIESWGPDPSRPVAAANREQLLSVGAEFVSDRGVVVPGETWPGRVVLLHVGKGRITVLQEKDGRFAVERQASLQGITTPEGVEVIPESRMLVLPTLRDGIRLLDQYGNSLGPPLLPGAGRMQALAAQPGGRMLAMGNETGQVYLIRVDMDAWIALAEKRLRAQPDWRRMHDTPNAELVRWLDEGRP